MKRLVTVGLLAASMLFAAPSFAWVCTVVGPEGHNYTSGGVGIPQGQALADARAQCRAGRAVLVPCHIVSCTPG